MPYFGDYGNASTQAYYEAHCGFYDFYVELASVKNPTKKLSFMFGTRSNDNMEMNLAVAGDDGGYGAESWYNSHADQRNKNARFSGWGPGSAIATVKYNFASQSYRDGFKDRNGNEVLKPNPISIYYDMSDHMTYTDTGLQGKSNGVERG